MSDGSPSHRSDRRDILNVSADHRLFRMSNFERVVRLTEWCVLTSEVHCGKAKLVSSHTRV